MQGPLESCAFGPIMATSDNLTAVSHNVFSERYVSMQVPMQSPPRTEVRQRRLPNARLVSVDRPLAMLATRLALAADLCLRGADALYVALARRQSAPLVTWDGEQLVRCEGSVEAVTPQAVVG